MRLLLILAALSGLSLAGTNKWGNLFNTLISSSPQQFDELHKSAVNFHGELEEPIHLRVKRAVYSALGIQSTCEAGWTGTFCESPICPTQGTVPSITQSQSKLIDQLSLPSGCTGTYYIPVDSMSNARILIGVSTSSGLPLLNLTNAQGQVMTPETVVPAETSTHNFYAGLVPGKYQINVDNAGVSTTHCIVSVEAVNSLLASDMILVNGPKEDTAPHYHAGTQGVMQNFAIHMYNFAVGAESKVLTVYQYKNSSQPVMRSLVTRRYQCSYEFFVGGTFSCDPSLTYVASVEGIDHNGYSFRRAQLFQCVAAPPPTQPPTSVPGQCLNGGTKMFNQCLCPELFTGASCEQALCMNGGTQLPEKLSCLCPDGFSGTNCDKVECRDSISQYLTDARSLIVVVRATASMAPYINRIVTMIDQEAEYLAAYGGFRNYILVTFANNDFSTNVYYPSQYKNFLDTLSSYNSTTRVGNCSDSVVTAIGAVFKEVPLLKSPIYIFTDVPANDYQEYLSVVEANAMYKFPIYPFVMNSSQLQQCQVNEMSEGYRVLGDLAILSGGLVFSPADDKFAITGTLLIRVTNFKQNIVMMDDRVVCEDTGYKSFFVDSSTSFVHIVVTGENPILAITDPTGKVSSDKVWDDGRNHIYSIVNVTAGEYLVRMYGYNSQMPCSWRIYALSEYDLFLSTTRFVAEDAGFAEPVYQEPRALVAQLNGLNVSDPFRLFSEIHVIANEGGMGHKPLYFSNGLYRSGCGYHLYFEVANFCERLGQLFYATVYADDNNGYTIQRTQVGYCAGRPIPPEPPTSCINGGVPNPQNTTQCICPPFYTGQYCQDLVCVNGGTYAHGRCSCPPGTGGTFCEEYACIYYNPKAEQHFNYESKTMNFVVSTRQSMQATWQQLSNNIQNFVRDVEYHSQTWISEWNLILVNQTTVTTLSSKKPSEFVANVQNVNAQLNNYYDPSNTNCSVQLLAGAARAAERSAPRSYVYIFTDSDTVTDGFVPLFNSIMEFPITISAIATAPQLCSPTGGFSSNVIAFVEFTGGWAYHATNASQVLNFIVTQYNSATISDRFFQDCSSAPQTYYIPVDGFAQSLTIAVGGDQPSVSVIRIPSDKSSIQPGALQNTLISESGTLVQQYIIPCDTFEWDPKGALCYRIVISEKMPFVDASGYCHNVRGALVDIFGPDKQADVVYETGANAQSQGVKIWLGLLRIGGTWYWDVSDGHSDHPLGAYNNWRSGVNLNDPNLACAIMAEDGYWEPHDCGAKDAYSLCQKHRYGQTIYPGDASTNVLPGGMWQIQVQTKSGMCSIQNKIQSTIQVYHSFAQDPHDDFGMFYANSDSSNNYFLMGTTGLSPFHSDISPSEAGRVNYVFMGFNGTAFDALHTLDRQGCAHQMISNSFSCQRAGAALDEFFIKFAGYDQYGYAFERVATGFCGKYIYECRNGGTMVNGQCACSPGFTGRVCEAPICEHGVQTAEGKCDCDPNFTGFFCELAYCEPPVPAPFGDQNKTLAILLETSSLMTPTIFNLQRNLAKVVQNLTAPGSLQTGWFENFVLYPFDSVSNMDQWYPPVWTSNLSDVLSLLRSIKFGCPGSGGCSLSCPRPYLTVLQEVLNWKEMKQMNSVVLVVTQSSPEDYELFDKIEDSVAQSRAKVHFLVTDTSSPCNDGWNNPAAETLGEIAEISGGSVFTLSSVEVVNTWLGTYFPTTFRGAAMDLGQGNQRECAYSEVFFHIEHAAYEFTINYFASTINVTLYNPNGDLIQTGPSLFTSATTYVAIVRVNDTGATEAGTWKLVTSAPGSMCYLSINVRSGLEIYPAYIQPRDQYNGATQDDAHYQPLLGEQNVVVVHADGLPEGASVTYAQAVYPRQGLFFVSEMRRRDKGCSFEFYSTKSFACEARHVRVLIYGTDEKGASFHRTFIANCLNERPTPPPAPAHCDLTAVRNDIVFMVDASDYAMQEDRFMILKSFIQATIGNYTLGNNNTNVGVITVSGALTPEYVLPLGQCTTANCAAGMTAPGSPGQNVTNAVNYILANFNPRTDQGVRRTIVYLTSTNKFTDVDPVQTLNSLRRGGSYGFTMISLNILSNTQTQMMANQYCSYYAKDMNDIILNGRNFLQSLTCLRFPMCGM